MPNIYLFLFLGFELWTEHLFTHSVNVHSAFTDWAKYCHDMSKTNFSLFNSISQRYLWNLFSNKYINSFYFLLRATFHFLKYSKSIFYFVLITVVSYKYLVFWWVLDKGRCQLKTKISDWNFSNWFDPWLNWTVE